MKMSLQRLAPAMIALGFLCSCQDDGPSPIYQGPPWPVTCTDSSRCAGNGTCSTTFGICVDRMPAGADVTFSVVPPANSGAVPDQFSKVYLTTAGRINVTVAPSAEIQGYLFRSDQSEDSNEPGKLVAEAPGRIPGLHFRSETRTKVITNESSENETTWTMSVLPGVDYMMTFLPDDTTIPTGLWPVNIGMSGILDLELPGLNTYFVISGLVRQTSDDVKVPVSGAVVTATVGGRLASSSVTDANGIFKLNLPPEDGEVKIAFSSGTDARIFPARTLKWDDLDSLEQSLPKTRFLVFDADPIPEILTVRFQVRAADDLLQRLVGTRIFLEGTTGEGTYTTNTLVDRNNQCLQIVPAGVYSMTVVPPSSGESWATRAAQYAVASATIDLTDLNTRDRYINLERRPMITGKLVYSGTQEPIAGARVMMATTLDEVISYESSFSSDMVHEAVSGTDGGFSLHLDPGMYSLRIEPPAGSGLAVASWPVVTVSGTENLQIGLEDGYVLSGTVISSTGVPLPDTLVTFLFPTTEETFLSWPFKKASFSYSIRKAGETVTDSNGNFEVILPGPDYAPTAIGGVFTTWQ